MSYLKKRISEQRTHSEILQGRCTNQSWQPATFLLIFAQHWACSPLADEVDSLVSVASVAQALQVALRISDFMIMSSPF